MGLECATVLSARLVNPGAQLTIRGLQIAQLRRPSTMASAASTAAASPVGSA